MCSLYISRFIHLIIHLIAKIKCIGSQYERSKSTYGWQNDLKVAQVHAERALGSFNMGSNWLSSQKYF